MKTIYVVENADTGDKIAFTYREDATKYIGKCYIEDEIPHIMEDVKHFFENGNLEEILSIINMLSEDIYELINSGNIENYMYLEEVDMFENDYKGY